MATTHSTPPESMLYIVHAAADRDPAILFRARIKDLVAGLQVFLASKAGEIPTGEDWLSHYTAVNQIADALVRIRSTSRCPRC